MKQINCKTCGEKYSPSCDYMQGRCPHRPALISTQAIKTRIQNIIKFFKGLK